jgi:hypothetical protein
MNTTSESTSTSRTTRRGLGALTLLVVAVAVPANGDPLGTSIGEKSRAEQGIPPAGLELVPPKPVKETATVSTSAELVQDEVIQRHVATMDFRRAGATAQLSMVATDLSPEASGELVVDARRNELQASTRGLPAPATFGSEYMTYVVWAISPDGHARNLGSLPDDARGVVTIPRDLSAFGVVVTAEPHAGVSIPSDVVVLESGSLTGAGTSIAPVDARYELIKRGTYSYQGDSSEIGDSTSVPWYVAQARNARRIALDAGAQRVATDTFARGDAQLAAAMSGSEKARMASARQAAQTFEQARRLSVGLTRQPGDASSSQPEVNQ